MFDKIESLGFQDAKTLLTARLEEPAPGRVQFLVGPRQVGKTTLLLELAEGLGEQRAVYASADAPEAALPHWREGVWRQAVDLARTSAPSVLFLWF
jgi:ABC-type hemin transport system ATPase subunit